MILVDAHNLLHQDARLGPLVRRNVETARLELERTLGARDVSVRRPLTWLRMSA